MPSTQALKRRITTAKNIRQITKAMEMVSASKMRRAQGQALSSRPYARKIQATLQAIAGLTDQSAHPLLQEHEEGKDIIILVSTDKSLAGSLNTNLFRGTQDLLPIDKKPEFIIVGQKARQFIIGNEYPLYAEFTHLHDPLSYQDTLPISQMVLQGFISGEFRSVNIIYMDFISTLLQKISIQQLLPIATNWEDLIETPSEALKASEKTHASYQFEPSAAEILNWLLPYYVELSVYQILLEAKASEHSARMVAMKNASENAGDIITDLTLTYNKVRQASITSALIENTTAALIVK